MEDINKIYHEYHPSKGSNTSAPLVPTTQAIRANTPIGAKFIIMPTILYIISATLSKKAKAGLPFSPMREIAIPTKSANTMICNMLSVTIALSAFVGTRFKMTSAALGMGLASKTPTCLKMYPPAGLKITANMIARVIAIAVVTRK